MLVDARPQVQKNRRCIRYTRPPQARQSAFLPEEIREDFFRRARRRCRQIACRSRRMALFGQVPGIC
jgi:hypothetical protein